MTWPSDEMYMLMFVLMVKFNETKWKAVIENNDNW